MRKFSFITILSLAVIVLFNACSEDDNYGEKVEINKTSDVFIKDGATKEEGEKLGQFLLRNNYFDQQTDKAVQLLHDNNIYIVKFVVKEDKIKGDQEAELGFRYMNLLLKDSVFAGQPTRVVLADDKFKDIRTVNELSQQEIDVIKQSENDTTTTE